MGQKRALGADEGIRGHFAGWAVGRCQRGCIRCACLTALKGLGERLDRYKLVGARAVRPVLPLVLPRGHLSACGTKCKPYIPTISTYSFCS